MSKRTHNPNQAELFANYSEAIKAHHLKRLRELREEFAKDAKRDARRARLIDNAERAEAKAELNLLHSATLFPVNFPRTLRAWLLRCSFLCLATSELENYYVNTHLLVLRMSR